jgi:hypothetical protein
MSSPTAADNDNIDTPSPASAVTDADVSFLLLRDTLTNEKGEHGDSSKNTNGDNVDAVQKNSESADIALMLDPDARKLFEES